MKDEGRSRVSVTRQEGPMTRDSFGEGRDCEPRGGVNLQKLVQWEVDSLS